jgi:hypothetical protein
MSHDKNKSDFGSPSQTVQNVIDGPQLYLVLLHIDVVVL